MAIQETFSITSSSTTWKFFLKVWSNIWLVQMKWECCQIFLISKHSNVIKKWRSRTERDSSSPPSWDMAIEPAAWCSEESREMWSSSTWTLSYSGDLINYILDTSIYLNIISGDNCASKLTLSIQDPEQPRGLRSIKQFCSPLTSFNYQQDEQIPIIIDASLVFLDFFTINGTHDLFSGSFSFKNSEF